MTLNLKSKAVVVGCEVFSVVAKLSWDKIGRGVLNLML